MSHVLDATSKGYRVARWTSEGPVDARIQAVFAHACNTLTESGEILTLLEQERRGPATIVIPGLSTALATIHPEQPVILDADVLTMGRGRLQIDLRKAQVWARPPHPHSPLTAPDTRRARIRQAVEATTRRAEPGFMSLLNAALKTDVAGAVEGLHGHDEGNSLQADGKQRGREAVRNLTIALRWEDLPQACTWAERLIGLGPGLTPAGDDFLTGLLLALHYAQPVMGERLAWVRDFGQQVVALSSGRTTLVSQQQLRYAAEGEADEITLRAVVAMLWGTGEESASIEALLGVGSSSGADTLTGICVAVELLHGERNGL